MTSDWLNIFILALLSLQSTCFVFDSDEIKSLNFVVDILDQPVILSEAQEERTVWMYNRAGQPYSCLLPDTEPLLQQHREEAEASQQVSIPSLLAPMASGPCLQRTRDWWTYELCPMSEIRQYHMEGGQVMGKMSILGRFESDYNWAQDDGLSRNAKQRYHSQTYVNGSDCDLIGKPRSAEVRYVCEEEAGDALVRVDEPETCRYVLTVHTARVCGHRALAPPPGRRPHAVTCRPAISADQMHRLAEARLERARRDAERAARWAAERESREQEQREEREQRKEREREEEEVDEDLWKERRDQAQGRSANFLDKGLSYLEKAKHLFNEIASQIKKLGNVLDDVIHNYIHIVSDFNTNAEYGLEPLNALRTRHQVVRDHHDAHAERIRALFELAEEGHYQTSQIVKDLLAYTDTLSVYSEVMIGISEESRRLKEFMSTDPSMVTDSTLGRLVKAMASLSSLSIQLQRFFADTEVWQAELLSWQTDLVQLAEGDDQGRTGSADRSPRRPEEQGAGSDGEDPDSAEAADPQTSRAWPEGGPVSSEDSEEQAEPEDGSEDGDGEGSSDSSKKGRMKFSTLRSLGLDKMVQISEIDREQRDRIERAVKQRLGKVGLDTNGPEIKVRFLKFPDLDHLDKEHTLSEEEMTAFENALIAVMMGGNEALVEHEKHSQQAKNYEYSFDKAVRNLESEPEEASDDETPAVDESLFRLV